MWNPNSIIFVFTLFSILALWGISEAWIHQSRTETIHPFKAFVHLLAFYLSYLLIPLWFLIYMLLGLVTTQFTKVFLSFS